MKMTEQYKQSSTTARAVYVRVFGSAYTGFVGSDASVCAKRESVDGDAASISSPCVFRSYIFAIYS